MPNMTLNFMDFSLALSIMTFKVEFIFILITKLGTKLGERILISFYRKCGPETRPNIKYENPLNL